MKENFHVRFLEEEERVTALLYSAITRIFTDPRVSASTVAPVDVAHTYGSRHTWRSVSYRTVFLLTDDE